MCVIRKRAVRLSYVVFELSIPRKLAHLSHNVFAKCSTPTANLIMPRRRGGKCPT